MDHPSRRAPASPSSAPSSANAPGSAAPLPLAGGRSGPAPPLPAAAATSSTQLGSDGLVPLPTTDAPLPAAGGSTGDEVGVSRQQRAESEESSDGEHCIICLGEVRDRTVIVTCGHDHFCFHCINVWADQSRRCPLCSRPMGDYLLHDLQTPPPFVKFFLPPFVKPSTAHPQHPALPPARRRYPPQAWRRTERAPSEEGDFERRLERRRELYRFGLYAKHVASNPTTRYKPAPTPAQFAANADLVARAQIFLRREFLVWTGVDTEFMVTYVVGLMQTIDIRSDAAVRLLRDFLDVGTEQDGAEGGGRAEHFAHEVYSFLRSPFRDLKLYDAAVQYDAVPSSSASTRRPSPPPRSTQRADNVLPRRDDRSQARLASAFENLVGESEGGALGEALGGARDRVVRADDDDEASSDGEGSSRGRGRSRGRSRSRSPSDSRSRSRSRSYDSRDRSRSRSRRPHSPGRYSRSRSRSPGPARCAGRARSRSLSPRPRCPGPPLSPRRWDRNDSWVSPEELDRLARSRAPHRGGRGGSYGRDDFRRDDFRRADDERVPSSGRGALPDQGALFGQRGARRAPLGDRRGGPFAVPVPHHQQPPPPADEVDLMEVGTLGEGMRAWSSNAGAPVTALDPAALTPHEADAHAAAANGSGSAGHSLLGRIAGLDPQLGLRINGRASNGKAPPTGPRAARQAAAALGIRGAARGQQQQQQPIAVAPAPVANGSKATPVKAKGPPRNVLLQRLAEAKADALRVSALKAARAAAASPPAQDAPPTSTAAADDDAAPPTGISVTPLKQAATGPGAAARRKPDVSGLKSKILERLQAERLRSDVSNGGSGGAGAGGGGGSVAAEGSARADSDEQALRAQLLERRKG